MYSAFIHSSRQDFIMWVSLYYENNSDLNNLPVNAENDRETDGYTAVDYIRFGPILERPNLHWSRYRAVVRTLNGDYSTQAFGLGSANTTYPVSAFITHLLYLKGTYIKVDVEEITASDIFLSLIIHTSNRRSINSRRWVYDAERLKEVSMMLIVYD